MDPVGVDELHEAILYTHGVEATFVESVPVTEMADGKVVWEGEVQVFDLIDHPQAKRAFVWSYVGRGTKRRVLAVLQIGPVTDAAAAVRAAIADRVTR